MPYQIHITPTALEALKSISDQRTRNSIIRRIDTLAEEPEKQGKPLRGLLAGFMSTRAAGQRYRIIFKVERTGKRVLVYTVGLRREGSRVDVYNLAERLVQRGLI